MIVKNEAANIRAVLETVLPHVDHYTILDTGSTDNTIDVINEVREATRFTILGQVIVEPVEPSDFRFDVARNRVMALDAAAPGGGVFQLMLSGDEYLRGGDKLREHLEQHRDSDVDCHWVQLVLEDDRSYQARVLRTGSAWKYESDLPMGLHEVVVNHDQPDAKAVGVPGALIEHNVSDVEARLSNIWEHHIPLLRDFLEENPEHERALTFLAQSYRTLHPYFSERERVRFAYEQVGLYLRRLAIPTGHAVERNYIRLQLIDAAKETSLYTPAELLRRTQELAADDPARPEVALLAAKFAMPVLPAIKVYELAAHAARVAEAAGGIDNSLPVPTNIAWKAHHLAAGIAKQLSRKLPDQTFKFGDAPAMGFHDLAREHVSAGMRAGGSWETFKAIVIDAEPASGAM
jgi:hypothetical protein